MCNTAAQHTIFNLLILYLSLHISTYTHLTTTSPTRPLSLLTGKSTTTVYTAPTEDCLPPPAAPPPASSCAHSGCNHCDADEAYFSDYDAEFIESAQNNYATYYFQDSGGEEEKSPRASTAYDHSSGGHGHSLDHSSGAHGHSSGGHVHGPNCNHDHSHGHSHSHDHSHSSTSGSSSKINSSSGKNSKPGLIHADDRV